MEMQRTKALNRNYQYAGPRQRTTHLQLCRARCWGNSGSLPTCIWQQGNEVAPQRELQPRSGYGISRPVDRVRLACRMTSRRGGRVVECTALEMRHGGNSIGGSNPSLSAITFYYLVKFHRYFASRLAWVDSSVHLCEGLLERPPFVRVLYCARAGSGPFADRLLFGPKAGLAALQSLIPRPSRCLRLSLESNDQ